MTNLHLNVRLAFPSDLMTQRSVVVTLNEDLKMCRCKALSVHSDPILLSGYKDGQKLITDKNGFAAYSHHMLKRKLRLYAKNKVAICQGKKKWGH